LYGRPAFDAAARSCLAVVPGAQKKAGILFEDPGLLVFLGPSLS